MFCRKLMLYLRHCVGCNMLYIKYILCEYERRRLLFLPLVYSFSTTSYITLTSVDVAVLLESAYQLLGLLDEVRNHLLVVLDILTLFEDWEKTPSSVRIIAILPSFGSR